MVIEFRPAQVLGQIPIRALCHSPEIETGLTLEKGFGQMVSEGISEGPGAQTWGPGSQASALCIR